MAFHVVYDACALHPAGSRDLLVRLGQAGLFRAHWTEDILDEMVRSILRRQPELDPARLARTRQLMCDAIPNCLVTDYEELIEGLTLPDVDDRHVLAAAIKANAQVIVTENKKDFPADYLGRYGIETQSPDTFVLHLVDLAASRVASIAQQQAAALTRPARSTEELLDHLAHTGFPTAAAAIRSHLAR